ncbi:MAG: AI-2E family transporter [Clostridia bacterium]|nr:AI-2E family transporter [Clostridia bacterium]
MKHEQRKLLPIGIGIFVLYLCIRYWDPLIGILLHLLGAAVPLILGCALAYVLNILMSLYEKIYFPKSKKNAALKTRRPICLTLAFLTLLAIIAVVSGLILPQLISCVMLLVDEIPGVINDTIAWMDERDLLTAETLNQLKSIDWASILEGMSSWLTSGLGSMIDIVVSTVTAVVSGVITVFLAVIFAIYLLSSKEKLARQGDRIMRRYLKPKLIDRIEYVLDILNDCFRRYIVGQCTEAVILGVLCLIGMLILGLPYATMISAFVAFSALIPFAGAYIGAGVGAFMILTVSPLQSLIFLIFIIILQQLEGNLIYPRVVGSSLELPPMWVLAAITVGGGMFGIVGMLLGVPFTAALYRILKADVKKGEAQKKLAEEAVQTEPETKE